MSAGKRTATGGGAPITTDGGTAFSGDQSMGGNKLTHLADPDPASPGDAVNVGTVLGLGLPVDIHFGGAITNASDTWMFCASGTSLLTGPTNPPRLGLKPYAWIAKAAYVSVPVNSMNNNNNTIRVTKTTAAGVTTTINSVSFNGGATTNGAPVLAIDLLNTQMAPGDAIDVEFINTGGTGTIRAAVSVHGVTTVLDASN